MVHFSFSRLKQQSVLKWATAAAQWSSLKKHIKHWKSSLSYWPHSAGTSGTRACAGMSVEPLILWPSFGVRLSSSISWSSHIVLSWELSFSFMLLLSVFPLFYHFILLFPCFHPAPYTYFTQTHFRFSTLVASSSFGYQHQLCFTRAHVDN